MKPLPLQTLSFVTINTLVLMISLTFWGCSKSDSGGNTFSSLTISHVTPAIGPGGTIVTITGTGFSTAPTSDLVYFNGKPATVSQASATQLVVLVPTQAGSGPVTLKVNNNSVTGPIFTYSYEYVVTTLAGDAYKSGSTDGTGNSALFNNPTAIVIDPSGNLFVTDANNNEIRKVTPAGVVTTFAGSPTAGRADGSGSLAQFSQPFAITIDPSSVLYVAEEGNNEIRRIDPSGSVTTIAGNLGFTSVNGIGTAASFGMPDGITIDPSGNLYVADWEGNDIREITTPGYVVTTFAGSQLTGIPNNDRIDAVFTHPWGVAFDGNGNFFLSDAADNRILEISSVGLVSTLAGNPLLSGLADGTGSAAAFSEPANIAVDSVGNLYVCDYQNNCIRKVTQAGVVTTIAGVGPGAGAGSTDGVGVAARFQNPSGIAIDKSGNIYVADAGDNEIRKISYQ